MVAVVMHSTRAYEEMDGIKKNVYYDKYVNMLKIKCQVMLVSVATIFWFLQVSMVAVLYLIYQTVYISVGMNSVDKPRKLVTMVTSNKHVLLGGKGCLRQITLANRK